MLSLSDWVLRTDANLDGDSLSYMDMLERNSAEERRRERERAMMEEGKALWKIKMDEEKEIELRSQQQVGRSVGQPELSLFTLPPLILFDLTSIPAKEISRI